MNGGWGGVVGEWGVGGVVGERVSIRGCHRVCVRGCVSERVCVREGVSNKSSQGSRSLHPMPSNRIENTSRRAFW